MLWDSHGNIMSMPWSYRETAVKLRGSALYLVLWRFDSASWRLTAPHGIAWNLTEFHVASWYFHSNSSCFTAPHGISWQFHASAMSMPWQPQGSPMAAPDALCSGGNVREITYSYLVPLHESSVMEGCHRVQPKGIKGARVRMRCHERSIKPMIGHNVTFMTLP